MKPPNPLFCRSGAENAPLLLVFWGLTIPFFLTIINSICKDDDVQRAELIGARSEPGRVQARCAGGSAALQGVPGEESGAPPALWALRGCVCPLLAHQPEWYRECVCSSPDDRRFFDSQEIATNWPRMQTLEFFQTLAEVRAASGRFL